MTAELCSLNQLLLFTTSPVTSLPETSGSDFNMSLKKPESFASRARPEQIAHVGWASEPSEAEVEGETIEVAGEKIKADLNFKVSQLSGETSLETPPRMRFRQAWNSAMHEASGGISNPRLADRSWVIYAPCCVTRLFHLLFQNSSAASSPGSGYLMSPLLTVWVVQREVMHVRAQNLLLTVRSVCG